MHGDGRGGRAPRCWSLRHRLRTQRDGDGRSTAVIVCSRYRARMLGPARRHARVPLRPRRRAHRHRQRPRRGLEADVRRVPARARRRRRSARSTSSADYGPYVDGKPRLDGTDSFLRSRGIELPEGGRDDAPDAETVTRCHRKNDLVQEKISTDGVEVYPGSVRYLRGRRRPPVWPPPSCRRQRQRRAGARGRPASTQLIDHRVDGVTADGARPARQARAGHVPGRRRRPRRRPGRRPWSSRTRWPASQSGRAGGFGVRRRRRPARPGRRAARRTAPTSSSPTSPTCWREDPT